MFQAALIWPDMACCRPIAEVSPFWALATSSLGGVGAAAGIALINSIGNTGGFVGPYLVGYLRDATDSFAWGFVAIGAVLAFVPMLVLRVDEPLRRS